MPANCQPDLRPSDTRECVKACAMGESPARGGDKTSERGPASAGENSRQEKVILNPSRSNVEWVVSQWSACELQPGAAVCARTSGVRYRNVTCERKDRRILMDDFLCTKEERKPSSSEPCELLCRQDCIVTPFTAWSSCDLTCRMNNRTRTRKIVVPPRHRGDHCPPFSEMHTCDNCSESFTYKLAAWGACNPIDTSTYRDVKSHHIIGHQSREITCLTSKGTLTTMRSCREKIPDALLFKHQSCVIPQDCKVSTWSALRPHNNSCLGPDGSVVHGYMKRTREVLQLPLGEGMACPPNLLEYVQLQGEDASTMKSCKRAEWILSSWSVCTTVPGYSHCGTGIHSRRAICVAIGDDGVQRPVEESECPQPKPLVSQACQTVCNWDCSVSKWSPWSSCENGTCASHPLDYLIRRRRNRREGPVGKRYRTREILTLPGPGGKSCPHLSETQACKPLPCFQWRLSYGPCEASARGGCGPGTRQRMADCVNREEVKVKARFCWEHQTDNRPWEECYVLCPGDCALSEWGSWSPCPDPCGPRQSGQALADRVRTRRIVAYAGAGQNSVPCPNPATLGETEKCPAPLECTSYLWKSSGWGICTVQSTCGLGKQNREVACYNSEGLRVLDERCEETTKPTTTQDCLVQCPVDCHVTEWSEWSDCDASCRAALFPQFMPKQRRRRFIVTYPQNGGLSCPYALSEERQCLNLPVCETYYWDVSDWSDCILPPIVPLCGDGHRARNVTCRHSNGTQYGLNMCLDTLSNMPALVEQCFVSCSTECQLSEWEPWGRCVQGCQGKKFRWRKLIGESKVNPECSNVNKYPLDERRHCVCDSLRPVLIGGWSDCILKPSDEVGARFAQMSLRSLQLRALNDSDLSDHAQHAYCGPGIRYKAISCQTSARDLEAASSCSTSEYQEEECSLPCPQDCKLSPWLSWSACSVSCGSGIQQRIRSIQTLPENGGRKCPISNSYSKIQLGAEDVQSRVCTEACQYPQWKSDDWGPCLAYGELVCGPGTQTREVGCYAVMSDSVSLTVVDPTFCEQEPKPDNTQDCHLPCPGECVMSQWSLWTPCTQPCNGQQTQRRTRTVLRRADQYSVSKCDLALQDGRVCIRGDNCFEYLWELSDWTSCLINGGSEACGVGHKERFAMCRTQDGQRVDDFHCTEQLGPVTEPLVLSCQISCDKDCLLSDWSDWSTCSESCGLGVTTRYRMAVHAPVENGRKCPQNMAESRPCFKQACYQWLVTEWSPCQTQAGVCGMGLQVRNVSCVGSDGQIANSSRCPHDTEKLILKTRRSCHVPCPGECRLSDWSQWSKCFISCQDFEQGFRTGVKARSRAVLANPSHGNVPCEENLWEEASCQAEACLSFQWTATSWDSSPKRQIVCRRSDGLIVEGGCPEELKPAAELRCEPACTVPDSLCVDTNLCGCDLPLVPVYVNRTLQSCIMNVSSTTPLSTSSVQPASITSPWMYAVIAVGTIFVISVAAALYNMCELFRTGPRPRRKNAGKGDGSSDTQSGTRTPVTLANTINAKNTHIEELYKQCHPQRSAPPAGSYDDYQNMDTLVPDIPPTSRTTSDAGSRDHKSGTGNDVERGRDRNVGRHSMKMACSPEESERLLLPQIPQFACSSPSSSLPKSHNRRYPAWQTPRQVDGRGCRRLGVLSACFRGSRKVREEVEMEDEELEKVEVRFKQKLFPPVSSSNSSLKSPPPGGGGGGGVGASGVRSACVEVHTNSSSSPETKHPHCMLAPSRALSPHGQRLSEKSGKAISRSGVSPTHISVSPSGARERLSEGLEMSLVGKFPRHSAHESEEIRTELRNRGSLSNISELSFDNPVSESSLTLGTTAENFQPSGSGKGKAVKSSQVADVLEKTDSPLVSAPRTPKRSDPDIVCSDPRILHLLKPKKDWSLDSGRSTLPPSRNGSLEAPMESSTSTSLNDKRQKQQTGGILSPTHRDLSLRHSLDYARAARKNTTLLPVTQPCSIHSPTASRPSSLSSSSPSLRQQLVGSRHPSGLSSPGSRSVCDSCQKVMGPREASYTSDTPDSLSEMSERSGMETTV